MSAEYAHACAQTLDDCFDTHDVSRLHHAGESHPFNPHEEDQLVAVLRLGQDQDGANLGHGLRQQGWRQRLLLIGTDRERGFVRRDVLDSDDPDVGFELRHAIHQQKRKAVGQDAFDGRVVER